MKTLLETASELGSKLAEFNDEEEKNRKPSTQSIALLRQHGLLKLFLPKSLGGLEIDPVTVARVVEEIATHNVSAGWSMMVANVAAWWCNALPEAGVNDIYGRDGEAFVAGAFHPPMRAIRDGDGYRIHGRSPLASNVNLASWVFVTALVLEEDHIKMTNGVPEVLGVYMARTDCRVIDTWYTNGMRATDSNDILAEGVFVPHHRLHHLAPGLPHNKYFSGPLYSFPAIGASIACLLAPVAIATARNAIDEFKMMAAKKVPFGSTLPIHERGAVQRKLGLAEAYVQSSRALLYQSLADNWKRSLAGEVLTLGDKAGILLAATHANQMCCQAVDLIYSAAGSSAIYSSNKIAYHFSNAQVIRQHGFMNDSRYETAAQVYLGLQPDLPVVAF